MKGTNQKAILFSLIFIITTMLFSLVNCYAGSSVPFFYNVMPVNKANSIIDINFQQSLRFDLYEDENAIYYNGQKIEIIDNSFEIDISNLSGKTTFTFTNDKDEQVSFTYYISSQDGLVLDYDLGAKQIKSVFVKTIDDIKVIYSDKDEKAMKIIEKAINNLPKNVKSNVKKITLLPYSIDNATAGITKDTEITLYNISKLSSKTIERVIIHEIAHTWAGKLMTEKKIDYSYTGYSKEAKKDSKFVSAYSKKQIMKNGNYNEDFADSVASLMMNQKAFQKKFSNRANYILNLMER